MGLNIININESINSKIDTIKDTTLWPQLLQAIEEVASISNTIIIYKFVLNQQTNAT